MHIRFSGGGDFNMYFNRVKYSGFLYYDLVKSNIEVDDVIRDTMENFVKRGIIKYDTIPEEFEHALIRLIDELDYKYTIAINHVYRIEHYISSWAAREMLDINCIINIKDVKNGVICINGTKYNFVCKPSMGTDYMGLASCILFQRNNMLINTNMPTMMKSARSS